MNRSASLKLGARGLRLKAVRGLAFGLVAVAVSGCAEVEVETTGSNLEGGQSIDPKETGFRVMISAKRQTCSVTLVGSRRLLTAAHCVAEMVPGKSVLDADYGPGATLRIPKLGILRANWNNKDAFLNVTVENTVISPGWVGQNPRWKPGGGCKGTDCLAVMGHDVAVISLTQDIEGAIVPVSTEAIRLDDKGQANVTIYGGGKKNGEEENFEFSLKKANTKLLSRSYWEKATPTTEVDAALVKLNLGTFVLTDARQMSPSLDISLTKVREGDSGGALVFAGKVVGVNSLKADPNLHAPLAGRYAQWIEENVYPERVFNREVNVASRK
jgi:Trypsin